MVHGRDWRALMRRVAVAVVAVLLLGLGPVAAANPTPDLDVTANLSEQDQDITVGMSKARLAELGDEMVGSAAQVGDFAGPWSKFGATSPCSDAPPGPAASDDMCPRAVSMCARNSSPEALGPAVFVWRALVDRDGNPVDGSANPIPALVWSIIGFTCFPAAVPGAAPTLTMEMILKQFHDTNFAHPTVSVQPVNGRTLVNLPTYFELKWPEAGFQPDEVDTTTLIGRQVRIKPALKQAVYVFGDGQSFGPTTSLGGPHPTGDVTHTYRSTANAQVRVDVTYSGQFSVDGGPWIDVPGEATVAGDPFPLEVLEAHAQLVTR